MREWSIKFGDPTSLVLCADARLSETSYVNDQIWELKLGGGDPPALSFQTTFGLRACSFRLFPRISEGDMQIVDPLEFFRAPIIRNILPNYILLDFSPIIDVDVVLEYWVPHSQNCCGRITVINQGSQERNLRINWIGQLSPNGGERMAVSEIQNVTVLTGKTGNLNPILFLSGGPLPGSGTYPSLSNEIFLKSKEKFQVTWSQSALPETNEAFNLARSFAARKWDAEIARLELISSNQMEIYTGNQDWDAAIMFSQKIAINLICSPTSSLPFSSFVESKTIDQGFSLIGNGVDHNYLWNGQSPLETFFLSSVLLPSHLSIVEGLLKNFLSIQEESGFIDWKPGLAGQRSKLLATPILSSLAWDIFEYNQDRTFIEEVFDPLAKFVNFWLSSEKDRDRDGYPEWDHPFQIGLDDHPVYSYNQHEYFGLEINTSECPSLGALLYQECKNLSKMANILDRPEAFHYFTEKAEFFKNEVNKFWDLELGCYLDHDRDNHNRQPPQQILIEQRGPRKISIRRKFKKAIRLQISIITESDFSRKPLITINGTDSQNNPIADLIQSGKFKWLPGKGYSTTQKTFMSIKWIVIENVEKNDTVRIEIIGLDNLDISQLLPLWAGIPLDEPAQQLIDGSVLNPDRFLVPYGLQRYIISINQEFSLKNSWTHIPLSQMVLTGLIGYGFRIQANDIFLRIMNGIIQNLKKEGGFRRYYDIKSGMGNGEKDHLGGIVPIKLFMELLGVRVISPREVRVEGNSPFPWPVKIFFKGLKIYRDHQKTTIIFPNEQELVISDARPRSISIEADQITEKILQTT